MFIRKKKARDRQWYQLVESHRDNGKVRQRVLATLGPVDAIGSCSNVSRAIWYWRDHLEMNEAKLENLRQLRPWSAPRRHLADKYKRTADKAREKLQVLEAIRLQHSGPVIGGPADELDVEIDTDQAFIDEMAELADAHRWHEHSDWPDIQQGQQERIDHLAELRQKRAAL